MTLGRETKWSHRGNFHSSNDVVGSKYVDHVDSFDSWVVSSETRYPRSGSESNPKDIRWYIHMCCPSDQRCAYIATLAECVNICIRLEVGSTVQWEWEFLHCLDLFMYR